MLLELPPAFFTIDGLLSTLLLSAEVVGTPTPPERFGMRDGYPFCPGEVLSVAFISFILN